MTTLTAAASAQPKRFMLLSPSLLWLALGLAIFMTASWTLKDWGVLSRIFLPDNDDMARIAQVRDWLNGQGFNDLLQHRSGPPNGASMHWSRIADAGIALPILLLTPLIGSHAAELVAIVLYPGLLFFAYLLLIARLARRLGDNGARLPALILAALAFPTISLFLPGRIDHHGLQIVLTLLLLDCVVAPPSLRAGAVAGLATALSLAVGLETAPEILAALAATGIAWLIGGAPDDRRALGFAGALGAVTLLLLLFARPHFWPEQWCDGFTPASSRATLVLAAAWGLLGASGRFATRWRPRLAVAAGLCAAAAAIVWQTSSVCIAGPYGALDPFLQKVWMGNVNEANSLLHQDSFGTVIAFGGLVLLGAALTVRLALHDRRWLAFAIFMLLGTAASVMQVRVTYIMAGVAVIPFAALLARETRFLRRLALWVLGAGIGWNLIAAQLDSALAHPLVVARSIQKNCVSPDGIAAIGRMPRGTIMAPLDLDSYLLAMTPHHVVASLYHRNNAGNLAMYRFFLRSPEQARIQAHAEGITYVAICGDELREKGLEAYRRGSFAERLQSPGPAPDWLEPIPTGSPIQFYRVR